MTRQEFSDILQSIVITEGTPQKELNKSVFPLSEALVQMLPQQLFRYRNCSPMNIEAFEQDKVYAVTANKFNDPYDCLVKYDINRIKKEIDVILTKENFLKIKEHLKNGVEFPLLARQNISQEEYQQIISKIIATEDTPEFERLLHSQRESIKTQIDLWLSVLAESNKRFCTIACFSETVSSITMWSHYADFHKGFALEYDLRPLLANGIQNVGIYPVIYSNGRFDATPYILCSFYRFFGLNVPMPDMTAGIKCALYKATQWEYEKEWRLIDSNLRTNVFQEECTNLTLKPVAIYYGQQISLEDKQKLHNIAEGKGLAEYEMFIDYSSDQYEMLQRRC